MRNGAHQARSTRRRMALRAAAGGSGLTAAVLAACAPPGQKAPDAVGAKRLRPGTTVTWRTYVGTPPLPDEINKLWTAKHPDIKITSETIAFGPHLPKLIADMAADTPPEVALVQYPEVPKVQPMLTNLAPYMARDRFPEKDFFPGSIEQYRFGGHSYALPIDFPIRAVLYNASMFQERGIKLPPTGWDDAGWSWDEYAEAARRATRVDGNRPEDSVWGVRWGANLPGLFEAIFFLINNDSQFLNKEGTECLLTQTGAVETLQFMHDLIQRWRVAPTPADLKVVPGGDRFIAGKTAMDIFRPVVLAGYRRDISFEWGIAPLPRGPRGKGRHTIMGGSAWAPPAPNKNKEEAWELLQHLTSPEVQRLQIQHVGIMPARRAVLEEYAGQEPPKNMRMVLRGADTTVPFPQTPWFPDAMTAVAPLLNQLWEGAISPSVAAQEAKRQIDPVLKQEYQLKLS